MTNNPKHEHTKQTFYLLSVYRSAVGAEVSWAILLLFLARVAQSCSLMVDQLRLAVLGPQPQCLPPPLWGLVFHWAHRLIDSKGVTCQKPQTQFSLCPCLWHTDSCFSDPSKSCGQGLVIMRLEVLYIGVNRCKKVGSLEAAM